MIFGCNDVFGNEEFEIYGLKMWLIFFKNILFLFVLFCFFCGSGFGKENVVDNEDIVIYDMYLFDEVQKKNNMENIGFIVVGVE